MSTATWRRCAPCSRTPPRAPTACSASATASAMAPIPWRASSSWTAGRALSSPATPSTAWPLAWAGPDFEPRPHVVSAEAGRRYIVNVGSVGQPRDRDPRAAYGVWDVAAGRVELRRVAYDVEAARDKIVAAGLPRFLADRLAAGT